MVEDYGELTLDTLCYYTKLSKIFNANMCNIGNTLYGEFNCDDINIMNSNENNMSMFQHNEYNIHNYSEKYPIRVSSGNQSNHVKRPMNAFMVWSKLERKRISSANPHLHNADISRNLGYIWKKLSDVERMPYIIESERLRNEHHLKYPGYKYRPKRKASFHRNNINISSYSNGSNDNNININESGANAKKHSFFQNNSNVQEHIEFSRIDNYPDSNDYLNNPAQSNQTNEDPMLTFSLNYDLFNSGFELPRNSIDKCIDQQLDQAANENVFNEILEEISPLSHDIDFNSWTGILEKPNYSEQKFDNSVTFESVNLNKIENRWTSSDKLYNFQTFKNDHSGKLNHNYDVPRDLKNVSTFSYLNQTFYNDSDFNLFKNSLDKSSSKPYSLDNFDVCLSKTNFSSIKNNKMISNCQTFELPRGVLPCIISSTNTNNHFKVNRENSSDLEPCDWLTQTSIGIQMLD